MNKKRETKKNKKKTHGALKTREAFKGTLKQWGLIRQAMLPGTENIDCFCDYTLTLSNVCGREGNYSSWGFFFWSLFSGNVCLQLHVGFFCFCFFFTCMAFCAHVWITHRQDEETETVPQGKQGGNERSDGREGGGVLLSSCFLSSSRSLLENKSAAGGNAGGSSGDELETTTRGALDRQEVGGASERKARATQARPGGGSWSLSQMEEVA